MGEVGGVSRRVGVVVPLGEPCPERSPPPQPSPIKGEGVCWWPPTRSSPDGLTGGSMGPSGGGGWEMESPVEPADDGGKE